MHGDGILPLHIGTGFGDRFFDLLDATLHLPLPPQPYAAVLSSVLLVVGFCAGVVSQLLVSIPVIDYGGKYLVPVGGYGWLRGIFGSVVGGWGRSMALACHQGFKFAISSGHLSPVIVATEVIV